MMHEKTANLPWEFTDKKITPWGGFRFFKEFMDKTGIREELAQCNLPYPGSNRGFDPVQIMESFWVSVWIGATRFSHTAIVRFDDALKDIFQWKRVPSDSTFRRFFKRFDQPRVDAVFNRMQRWFFDQIAVKSFTLDLDSSVITRYGEQEGSEIGYNPRKRGRRSHHPMMAFCADVRMVCHSWLRPGNTSSANNANRFLDESLDIIGRDRTGLLRADSGFFSDRFLSHIEAKTIHYIIAAKMNPVIKRDIHGLKHWLSIEDGIDVNEFAYKAHLWSKGRRIVVVRQELEKRPKAAGKLLFDIPGYRYQAFVTSLTLPQAEIWRNYRQRADCENRIEELKHDFGMEGFCTNKFFGTEAAFRSVMIAYNLISLFRQALLKWKSHPTLHTLKAKCLAIGSWIGKKYRSKVVKLSVPVQRRPWFEGLFSKIIEFGPPYHLEAVRE